MIEGSICSLCVKQNIGQSMLRGDAQYTWTTLYHFKFSNVLLCKSKKCGNPICMLCECITFTQREKFSFLTEEISTAFWIYCSPNFTCYKQILPIGDVIIKEIFDNDLWKGIHVALVYFFDDELLTILSQTVSTFPDKFLWQCLVHCFPFPRHIYKSR